MLRHLSVHKEIQMKLYIPSQPFGPKVYAIDHKFYNHSGSLSQKLTARVGKWKWSVVQQQSQGFNPTFKTLYNYVSVNYESFIALISSNVISIVFLDKDDDIDKILKLDCPNCNWNEYKI